MASKESVRRASKEELERRDGPGEPQGRLPVWVYGINDHLEGPTELPAGFSPSGVLIADFPSVCRAIGAAPHPAFKPKPPPVRPRRPSLGHSGRRPSVCGPPVEELAAEAEPRAAPTAEAPVLNVRSVLLDRTTMQILSLLLPTSRCLRVLCFSDCRLDQEMLQLLCSGLAGACQMEALQLEWNPLELPLPAPKDATATGEAGSAGAEGPDSRGGREFGSLEARERQRYYLQSQRTLRAFLEWIQTLHDGNLEAVWAALANAPMEKLLSTSDFQDVLAARLGVTGPQVAEVFDVLDGPDFAGGTGRTSLAALRQALEGLPQEPLGSDEPDPIGLCFAAFLDCDCVLESLSLRACAVACAELGPMAEALASCPWQLRCLNLWDNRVSDRGAEALALALDKYRGLEYLGLGRNRITDLGLESLCRPYQEAVLDQESKKVAEDRIREQAAYADGVAKAKAKAQAKPPAAGTRPRRERTPAVDEVEERRDPEGGDGEVAWVLRRTSELRCLVLQDNPIQSAKVVEALQSLGPQAVELVLRGTPAALALVAGRPELGTKEKRPFCPRGTGWVVRVA